MANSAPSPYAILLKCSACEQEQIAEVFDPVFEETPFGALLVTYETGMDGDICTSCGTMTLEAMDWGFTSFFI